MAGLRDSNGQIVIDEAEAQQDIRAINNAKDILSNVISVIDPKKLDDERMKGETRVAYDMVLNAIIKDLNARIDLLTRLVTFIQTVVRKYQQTDRELSKGI